MSTVSVKLSDETKERVARLAARNGSTSHAVMVAAIESTLDSAESHGLFVGAALASRSEMLESQSAFEGDEFVAYLRAKSRGEKPVRPMPKTLRSLARN